jgi:hypothetical protein
MEGGRLAEHWDVLQNDATRANPRVDYLCSETLFRHGAPTLRVRPARIAVEGPRSVYLLSMSETAFVIAVASSLGASKGDKWPTPGRIMNSVPLMRLASSVLSKAMPRPSRSSRIWHLGRGASRVSARGLSCWLRPDYWMVVWQRLIEDVGPSCRNAFRRCALVPIGSCEGRQCLDICRDHVRHRFDAGFNRR